MEAVIDRDGCISCGQCASTCQTVFAMADDGLAEVIASPIPEEDLEMARVAAEGCPVDVIAIED